MNISGITKVSAVSAPQILAFTEPMVAVGVRIDKPGSGETLYKAGTPMTGSLVARQTPFTKAVTADAVVGNLVVPGEGGTVVLPADAQSNAVGILLHDVETKDGDANGTLLIMGFVDIRKIDATTAALITAPVKEALNGKVTFIGD